MINSLIVEMNGKVSYSNVATKGIEKVALGTTYFQTTTKTCFHACMLFNNYN